MKRIFSLFLCFIIDTGLFAGCNETDIKNMLAASKEIADEIVNRTTTKFLFDERNVIVGFAEQ